MQVGDVIAWEKTFTVDDVHAFRKISGDDGVYHITPDELDRLIVHGLLTATLPTKIGGDLNFMARQMVFDFIRPVYTGDAIRCEITITSWEEGTDQFAMSASWICTNQNGKEVLLGSAKGIIPKAYKK